MFKSILHVLGLLIPHYYTDRVALNHSNGVWSVVCREDEVSSSDKPYISAYGTIKSITWLNVSAGGKVKLDDKYATKRPE